MDTGNKMKDFGTRLAWLRAKRGISQVEFAKLIGKSQGSVAYYEKGAGKVMPDDTTLAKMAAALETKVGSLMGVNDFIIDRFDDVVAQWLMNPESTSYVKEAFVKWATDKAK
ncbi:helix-turn-helix domain-containing protein [Pelosinus propionicus]|uniref:Helix-turn-helix n=1 Tax=Pelosinus propionicus DSM 13327 TaxID=1123291 RepID=A0A1I4JH92_9FIRM|nr:helix-turn-helix transcriptional regulator [Pelosinus propionicus]SFL65563.1 Helix-turn-helix [Pelosinus propionicus DSM 13327]